MRTLLIFLGLLFGFSASAQPLLRNLYTTNSFAIVTNTASASTNFVVDFNVPIQAIIATADINLQHSTNRQNGAYKFTVTKIYTGNATRQLWLNSGWKTLGSTTNYSVLEANKVVFISAAVDANAETNVSVVVSSQ